MAIVVLFIVTSICLLMGFPVAFTLAGASLLCASIGWYLGIFDITYLGALPNRLFQIIINPTLMTIPLFIFMGVMLEKSRIAEQLLENIAQLMGRFRGGLPISVILVGTLLAASTGIAGATIVTMGLISLPTMLRYGYHPSLACGVICATGTLGQIIPPSITLILLSDVLSNLHQQAQLQAGNYNPSTLSVGELFAAAMIPGLLLITGYLLYIVGLNIVNAKTLPPQSTPQITGKQTVSLGRLLHSTLAPIALIIAVLGSIATGIATPSEAAAVGALGASLLCLLQGELNIARLKTVTDQTIRTTGMIFTILLGASIFSLVFRGFDGEQTIHALFSQLPGGATSLLLIVLLIVFLLGFILDFIEIVFVVIPIFAPVLLSLGIDPIWLGMLLAVNLQSSFLTPPFGFALFYLRGVAPDAVKTQAIYRGVIPFIIIQMLVVMLLLLYPGLTTWLPSLLFN